jgi:predicted carbohydrate-binding protein with CBM5 and CBM33 domain
MKNAAGILAFLPLVAAHGFIKSPAPRQPGTAYKAACGEQPFYQQSSDINGNVQGIKQVVGQNFDAADCNLWLCKGFQFDDNKDNVQSYKLGEKIPFEINIAAPHTGYANVSVVKTSSDTMIGEPLIEFENYAANAGLASNNTAFSVTLPESLGGECTKAGDCVLQWFWDAPDINQTYESCVDFVVGGSGSGTAPAPSPSSGSGAEEPATSSPAADNEDDEDCDDEDEEPAATTAAAEKPAATTLQAVAISSAADSGSAQPTSAPVADDDEDCDDEYDDEEPIADEDEDCDEDEEPVADDDDEECPAEDDY